MLRKICAALALAAIIPVAVWATSSYPTGEEPERPASTITALAVATTNAIPCFGAQQVICILKATNASSFSAVTFQVSMDSVNWVSSTSWNGLVVQADSVAAVRLDKGGVPVSLSTSKRDAAATAGAVPYIPYRWCRLSATAGAVDVPGFAVETIVLRPAGLAETVGPVYQP